VDIGGRCRGVGEGRWVRLQLKVTKRFEAGRCEPGTGQRSFLLGGEYRGKRRRDWICVILNTAFEVFDAENGDFDCQMAG
jgi:hypothetical protein